MQFVPSQIVTVSPLTHFGAGVLAGFLGRIAGFSFFQKASASVMPVTSLG
jgi:hypothetical protein